MTPFSLPQENSASTWTATTMIETGLKAMIQLLEQYNGDVHGKSE